MKALYTSTKLRKLVLPSLQRASIVQSSSRHLSASVYVHWPYCERRCTYCNFNKYISKNVDHERMRKCLITELKTLIGQSGVSKVTSVFFGGGTPSLAEPETFSSFLDAIRETCEFSDKSEVTIEVNPTQLEAEKLSDFQQAGINRISVGIQTLNSDDLRMLGRDHSLEESLRCLNYAKSLCPGRVSIDLIYGRPGQTLEQWTDEISEVLRICDDHISLYQLTLERGTQLFKWVHSGEMSLPDKDTMADMYIKTVDILEEHGFERYEVSNFARNKAYSEHNCGYWTGEQYIGVGPGAHGRFTPAGLGRVMKESRIQTLEPDNWMYEVDKYGHGTRKITELSSFDRLEELLAVGLRMTDGVSIERAESICTEIPLADILQQDDRTKMLIENGFLIVNDRIQASKGGLHVVDSILADILHALMKHRSEVT